MRTSAFAHPPIVSRDEWLAERKKLLEHEKDVTKHRDRVNAERRRIWRSQSASIRKYWASSTKVSLIGLRSFECMMVLPLISLNQIPRIRSITYSVWAEKHSTRLRPLEKLEYSVWQRAI
jgi:hypothetical protein